MSSVQQGTARKRSKDALLNDLLPADHILHVRKPSDDVSPYESPDLYYGPKTDPANRKTHYGRLRTISAVFPRPSPGVRFNPAFLGMEVAPQYGSSDTDIHTAGVRSSHAVNGLFSLGDKSDDSDDDGDLESAINNQDDYEDSQNHHNPPRVTNIRRRSHISDITKPIHKKEEAQLGSNERGFMSDSGHLPESENTESDLEEDELQPRIASASNSTGSLLALDNQKRSNINYNIMPRTGLSSPFNRSVDSLESQSQSRLIDPKLSDQGSVSPDDVSSIESDDNETDRMSAQSEIGVTSPSMDPHSLTVNGLSSQSEEGLNSQRERSSSFVKRYNHGINLWNELTRTGKLETHKKDDQQGKRELTHQGFDPNDTQSSRAAFEMSPSPPAESSLRRRASADDSSSKINPKRFFISDIDTTLEQLLENEDTDHNCQITIEDTGPKVLKLGTANSNGFNQYDIRGTYMLANLLQELTIAKRMGRKQMILDEARLNENPVDRLTRLITTVFWKNLTRQVTKDTVLEMARDTKIHSAEAKFPRVYVPHHEPEQYYYYMNISKHHPEYQLQVEYLPEDISAEWVKSVNDRPGFLALAMKHKSGRYGDLDGYPYVVPGGRFNEQYGWDSYFETLGLLKCGKVDPCIGMCKNFIFEINHYGKILNANRSYYLCRSQPPFLTQMALRVFNYVRLHEHREELDLLKDAATAAIKEYNDVWCSEPRLDRKTGLSTYHPGGLGFPPETEPSHFHAVLRPYCEKYGISFEEFTQKYNDGEIKEPSLDEYLLNDRAVRESGHDTSYRLEGVCAHLATVDLNSLLYKYETDIAFMIETYFSNNFVLPDGTVEKSEKWKKLAKVRRERINKYMWNEEDSLYYDYNVRLQKPSEYESVTSLFPLWANLCSKRQAEKIVMNSIPKFEEFGGLVSGTKRSRGRIGMEKPSRQWDYPYAWAPHQMIAWKGLSNYGYYNVARRLAYRWCYMMTLAFVDFNGIVVEKYDATSERQPHKVNAEYGNQGSGFKGVATEGFGWVNASYLIGLGFLDRTGVRALGTVTPPRDFFHHIRPGELKTYALDKDQEVRARRINLASKNDEK
ncbi:alpha,alpha-trehalase nth1 [Brettanomyces nanus]|uniref:Trehalase n=1 Tax=Eeniella nana TaxID=13502 RepID=A0A875RX94_EENNA|nr:alpha,alpha-trehalase nth1 [Brettanomyces nanus]QPG74061.1 alpha,alpha-trehalase nth1 [Brettanomyces nanus]